MVVDFHSSYLWRRSKNNDIKRDIKKDKFTNKIPWSGCVHVRDLDLHHSSEKLFVGNISWLRNPKVTSEKN